MKKSPQTCGSTLCCKASASLEEEIENELKTPDKSLATILGEQTPDPITDDAPPAPEGEVKDD
jgi:hypothetical protein|tara:strand:- start:2275 stop:2463 length:189 start_codon:yes stop_codon:yes gene_type:complete